MLSQDIPAAKESGGLIIIKTKRKTQACSLKRKGLTEPPKSQEKRPVCLTLGGYFSTGHKTGRGLRERAKGFV